MSEFKLPLPFGRAVSVTGGPFWECPPEAFGVKMAEEIKKACSVSIPTRDFSTPPKDLMDKGLIQTLKHMLEDRHHFVYVGCMGGIGRTGLFLGVLAKAWGVKDPVTFTRSEYVAPGGRVPIETKQQVQYINDYEVPKEAKRLVRRLKFYSFFRF